MNRRQKIIVSVTGIFIVLLVLLGLTYAYFLTRITGNSNPTSISVTTANLELVYGDGRTAILTSETPLMPSSTPIGTKDFTVTNNGDDSEYVVVFEDITVKYAADTVIDGEVVAKDTPTTFDSNDFVYTLTCTVKDKSGNILSDKSCDGVDNETFPMDGGIVIGNSIDKDDVHNYVLTLYYLDNGLDQSADMNKALNGKINIKDIKSINPYSENTSSLAYNIINNSMLNKNGTELVSTPLTKPAEEINLETEKVLSVTTDDYGTSYYYRGNVEDNYVNFAGMCWRIVRIDGNGSTKLILEDQYTTCDDTEDTDGSGTTDYEYTGNWMIGKGNYGYEEKNVDSDSDIEYIMNYLTPVTSNTSSMVKAFYDFQTTKLADYTGKLKAGDWCLGDKAYTRSGSSGSYTYTLLDNYDYSEEIYYDSYVRLSGENKDGYNPILKCTGTVMNEFADVSGVSSKSPMYVSAITADEIVYAGGKDGTENGNYYLINNYQKSNYSYFWSLSPNDFGGSNDVAFRVIDNGFLYSGDVFDNGGAFRPSVSLASSAVITGGEGTLESPYIIG